MMKSQKLKTSICESCGKERLNVKTAVVNGRYYKAICSFCVGEYDDGVSGGAASYERRRGYEDNAQDTIQPYDANGKPRAEFYRLYPRAAQKTFTAAELEQVKRKI